jgi:hypothetical protein
MSWCGEGDWRCRAREHPENLPVLAFLGFVFVLAGLIVEVEVFAVVASGWQEWLLAII